MKPEKRQSKKTVLARIFCVLQRKFPQEVESATKELELGDQTAVELIAAASVDGIQGERYSRI